MKRRELLGTSAAALIGGIAGCGGGGSGANSLNIADIEEWPPAEYENEINVWNWYTGWRDVITERFMEEYPGVENANLDSYNNPGQFYAQIQSSHSIDSIGSTGEYTQRMMANDLAEPLPIDMMPNYENVADQYKEVTESTYADEGGVYGLPNVIVAMPVIAYRDDYFDSPPSSFDVFWDEDLAGNILMWDRDYILMQTAALYTGQDPHNPSDWDELREVLIQQKDLNEAYYQNHDTAQQLLASENAVVGATPTNSALQGHDTHDSAIRYTVPEEGTLFSIDQQVVPKGAPNPVAGAMFTDFSMSRESVEILWNESYAISSHADAFDIIADIEDDPELAELARYDDDWELSERRPLSEEVRQRTSDLYTEVMGA
ncbi:extracellular solute-binding protein [Haloarcula sp. S1CR25-12]|uniref:Extracellular solute-binding protein n=1 Tax=Haloarcula saliterrae TaxID=2950534 RepID=A0ABU2FFX1_9EURY|nr:extracellular solute-binding protein [Haloarcula sp. S1CR25-12]MDS0261139.1 extracellular solute-binding protein [Haloarcula sp. S1CR25-12]